MPLSKDQALVIGLPGQLRDLGRRARGRIDKIYLHWTAGLYDQLFDDYHLSIDGAGTIFAPAADLTIRRAHTFRRNFGAVGVALCCCFGAQPYPDSGLPSGDWPPTKEQIETMAKALAVLCPALGLLITPQTVLTHAEAAELDDYGPGSGDPETRWDLWKLKDADGRIKDGGAVLRGKAQWYLERGL
jgi:hypothetical protein